MLVSISNNDPIELNANKTADALTLGNFTVVSGVPLSFYINVTDENDVTMEDINQATASFRVSWQNSTNWRNETAYQIISLMGQDAIAHDGQFNFTGFTIITEPNSTFHLELTVNLRNEATQGQPVMNIPIWAHVR